MDDPKRWIEEGADDAERALLQEAQTAHDPSPGRREAVLAAVLAEVGGTGGGGSSSSGGSTTALKIGGAIVLGALVAWIFLGRRHDPPVPIERPASSTSIAPTSEPSASTVASSTPSVEQPPPVVQAPVAPKPSLKASASQATPSASASSTYASRLREESELIAHARESLRAGKYTEAQSFLDTAQTKFPNGVLGQERKALAIEILFRSGRRAEGEAMAQDFLATYPNSPHAAKIRELQKP